MDNESIYQLLGKSTEEMYMSLAKEQSLLMQGQLMNYHSVAEGKISELLKELGQYASGEMLFHYQKKFHILRDDFSYMKSDINSKYKIYLRGCGNAGKSTLLNALLSLREEEGSRTGRLPMTFVLDAYTTDLDVNTAEVRTIESDGCGTYKKMIRAKAIQFEDMEEKLFSASKKRCMEEVDRRCKNVYLEQERYDIERDVYRKKLYKTSIREIKWGIGKNNFFNNCLLIDTPGLSQELRFTNVLEDVKSYEVDGIIWVISTEALAKEEVTKAYISEMKELHEIYKGRKVVAVINMYGTGDDYRYGSEIWKRYEKKAKKIYCDGLGFNNLICVNAKLAYDGNINRDEKAIADSNISELRKVINEMFVERSTEKYHYDKLEKIENFLNNLYNDTIAAEKKIRDRQLEYNDKKNRIENQVIACRNMTNKARDKILDKHLVEIRGRIAAESTFIQNLDQITKNEQNAFIRERIVHPDEIERDLQQTMSDVGTEIFRRFQEQQRQSIISVFKTKEYAVKAFEESKPDLKFLDLENDSKFQYRTTGWEAAGNFLEEFFGENEATRIFRDILIFVKNRIKSPEERLYEAIEADLKRWVLDYDLEKPIGKYQALCIETVEKSLAQTCGNYSDVCKSLYKLQEFNSNRPKMSWEKVGINELLGGF